MSKPKIILLCGVALAIAVIAFGFHARGQALDSLATLEAKCVAERSASAGGGGFGGELVCDYPSLRMLGGTPVGVQAEITEAARRARMFHEDNVIGSAIAILFFASLPFLFSEVVPALWGFFLKRLREIADAVAGRGS